MVKGTLAWSILKTGERNSDEKDYLELGYRSTPEFIIDTIRTKIKERKMILRIPLVLMRDTIFEFDNQRDLPKACVF